MKLGIGAERGTRASEPGAVSQGNYECELNRTMTSAMVRTNRIESNLTQKELAEKIGIRQSNISRIENGNCSPTVATLQQIAGGLGKTLTIDFK